MALNANTVPSNNKAFVTMDAGTYPARLVSVVDLGLQAQRPFNGEDKPPAREIALTYEMVDEFMKDDDGQDIPDKPRWITEMIPFYNLQADKAKSTLRYKALDPTNKFDGDFSMLVNTPCNVTIVINPGKNKNAGRLFENIAGVTTMRSKDAEKCSPLKNETVIFDLDAPTLDAWKLIPKFIQDKIKSNLEYASSPLDKLLGKDNSPPKETTKDKAATAALAAETDDQPY